MLQTRMCIYNRKSSWVRKRVWGLKRISDMSDSLVVFMLVVLVLINIIPQHHFLDVLRHFLVIGALGSSWQTLYTFTVTSSSCNAPSQVSPYTHPIHSGVWPPAEAVIFFPEKSLFCVGPTESGDDNVGTFFTAVLQALSLGKSNLHLSKGNLRLPCSLVLGAALTE